MDANLVKIKKVINEIESNDCSWAAHYQSIRLASSKYDFSCAEAKAAVNRQLNRYRDVSPFDHNRVKLLNSATDYINASLITVKNADRKYILTQGALPHTSGHFWLMVWEQKSKGILMLNKIIEKGQIKCHEYWPTSKDEDINFQDVGLRVRLTSETRTKNFYIRNLTIFEERTGLQHEVLQFHYTTWPDFGVPSSPKAFLHFLQVVRDSNVLDTNYGPVIVHCSAGIGRSGTFCLVDSCLLMMEQGQEVDIKEELLEMRKSRSGLIQTSEQLKFSYMAILEGCQQLTDGNERFLPDLSEENGSHEENGHDKPIIPPRETSLPKDHHYREFINARRMEDRPLPALPSDASSSSDDDDDDDIDDIDESSSEEVDEDEGTSSKSYGLFDHLKDRKPSLSEIEDLKEDSRRGSSSSDIRTQNSPQHEKINGKGIDKVEEEENILRKRKIDATYQKISEIRAKQKKAEAYQDIYRRGCRKNIKKTKFSKDD